MGVAGLLLRQRGGSRRPEPIGTPADPPPGTGVSQADHERRLSRLELLRELNTSLSRISELTEVMLVFNRVVTKHCSDLGVSRVRLLLVDSDGLIRSQTSLVGRDHLDLLDNEKTAALKTLASKVLTERASLLVDDITQSQKPGEDVDPVSGKRSASALMLPVISRNESLGILEIDQEEGAEKLDEVDEEFFALIADQLGGLVENARLVSASRRAEVEARENEARYRLLAENNTDIIWTMDLTGRYTYISPSVSRILGYTPEEMRSQAALVAITPGPGVMMPEQRLQELGINLQELLQGKSNPVQHQMRHAMGHLIWMETRASMIREKEGAHTGFQGVSRDIETRIKATNALQESESRFRAIFEEAMDAIFILMGDGSIIDVNPMACHLLRRSRDEILAMKLPEIIMTSDPALLDLTREEFQTGTRIEGMGMRTSGDLFPMEASIALFERSEERQFLAIIRDISERREASRRQKVMDRRMRGIVEAADELISCPSTDQLFRRAVETARDRLGLGSCAIFQREGGRIRGTWGVDPDGYTVDRRNQVFPVNEVWNSLLRPIQKTSTRAGYHHLSLPANGSNEIKFPSDELSVVGQIRNAAQQPVALFLAEAAGKEGREAEDLLEVVAIYCSILGGILERRLIEDAIKESEDRARRAYEAKRREMDKIAEVHSRLLPPRYEPAANLAFAAQCRPSADVGGDFYLVMPLVDGRVAILIADVSGHGAKAAVATATSRALLHTALLEIQPDHGPAHILKKVSHWLQDQIDDEQFVTIWMAIWDPTTNILTHSSCAHHPAIIWRKGEQPVFLEQDTALPVGLSGVPPTLPSERQITMGVGDRIFVYTDGWVETASRDGKLLEGPDFLEFIAESEGQPLDQLPLFLFTQFEHFAANTSISDDVTLLAFERTV